MVDAELLRAMLLDKETFDLSLVHNCVLLFDKANAAAIHEKALGGDSNAVVVMQRVEKFNDARFRLVQALKNRLSLSFETLVRCDHVEQYTLGNGKILLVCSRRRGNTRSFIVTDRTAELYNAVFIVHNFHRIIKELFLCRIKQQTKKVSILADLCWSSWNIFLEKVTVLLDHIEC